MTADPHVTAQPVQLCPQIAVCPGCAGLELVGAGHTEWVCHGRPITIVLTYDGVDELGPLLEPVR